MKETKSAATKRVTKMNGFTPYYIQAHAKRKRKKKGDTKDRRTSWIGSGLQRTDRRSQAVRKEASQTNDNIKRKREERYKREILIINFIY